MNWKEFKEYVESQGVTDNMGIESIMFLYASEIGARPPDVCIHNNGSYKTFLIL